ncbi:hypothetical protein AB0D78_28055 [Streptomyces avermitilis]|uniref:hypothetical protein n=1 Tax=Streptomyces avermitilis TaxID=33903 RepID=UPI0033CEF6BD
MTPDERVAAYVLERFRATGYTRLMDGYDVYQHVRDCPTTQAKVEEQGDGRCGEGTCEMFYIEAEMRCEHGATYDFTYREGGEIADLIAHLATMDQTA